MEIVALIVLIFFFWLSMFFSGMETGMVSIDRFRLEQDAKSDRQKKKLLKFLEDPNKFLGITLIGNNVAIVVVSSIFAIYFSDKLPLSRSLSTLSLAAILLIFAEIIPKSYYRENADKLVYKYFPLIYTFYIVLKPFVGIINLISSFIAKVFRLDSESRYSFLTREELSIIFAESSFDESIEQPQREMLEDVMDFNELAAKNVMTPRLDIVAIKSDTPLDQLVDLAQEEGYTRYPVYEGNVDNIIGILIIYDLLKPHEINNLTAKDLIRETLFVPETIDINTLLKEMQLHRKSMAIVVDNFGGTSGLITTEDILEELVGEIEDEYDFPNSDDIKVKYINDNTIMVKGDIEIDYLNDKYNTELPEGDYETIAGLVIERLMKIPIKGQKIDVGNWTLEVIQVSSTKINQIMMRKIKKIV